MTAEQRLGAKALANSRRETIRRRTRRIRRSVAATSAVLFVSMFLVIYVQLASGHDPALTARSRRASMAATKSAASSSAGEETSSSPSPVTTSQS
jgi:hypothetical protein